MSPKKDTKKHPFWAFLIPTLILLFILGTILIIFPKDELHLLLCRNQQEALPFMDKLMTIITDSANWLPFVFLFILLFYKAGWSIFLLGNMLLTTILVQPIKHLVNAPRPFTWFKENMDINLLTADGVDFNKWLSFPSGHTATFFALFFSLSLIICAENIKGKNIYAFILFILATCGAYTRVYLSQHFTLDIFGGIWVAIISTLFMYFFYVRKVKNPRFWNWRIIKSKKMQ